MRNIVIVIVILSCFLSGCSKEKIDPYVISKESITGKWLSAKEVRYGYDPLTEELIDSSISYMSYEIFITNADTCLIQNSNLPFKLAYEIGFIEPDTFWIMPCPLEAFCETLIYPRKFKIVEFNRYEKMVMYRWNYYGLAETREYIRY